MGGTTLVPVELPHGHAITTGLIFQRGDRRLLAYMTDCQAVSPEAVEAARGADVLVIDALRHTSHSTHLTVAQAIDVVAEIRPKMTYFIHMCHELGHAETEAALPENIRLSYDGLRITV